jgi:hypothetical protein
MKLQNSTKGGIIYVILLFLTISAANAFSVKDVVHYCNKGNQEVATINEISKNLAAEGEFWSAEYSLISIANKYPNNYNAVLNLDNFYIKFFMYKNISSYKNYEEKLSVYRSRLWIEYLLRSGYARENPNALATTAVLTEDKTPRESLILINHAIAVSSKFKKQITRQVISRMKIDRKRIEQKVKKYNEEYFNQ